jgi:enterochelin esterase family protein
MAPGAATVIDGLELVFRLPDPDRSARSVRLLHDLPLAPGEDEFTWLDGVWTARVPRPWLGRVEYAYERTESDGTRTVVLDPSNPRRVGELRGHLGERSDQDAAVTVTRSWLPMPGYREPWWLSVLGAPGTLTSLPPSTAVRPGSTPSQSRGPTSIQVWTPSALDPLDPAATAIAVGSELPLLVVHDGPELAARASLVQYAAATTRPIPSTRAGWPGR